MNPIEEKEQRKGKDSQRESNETKKRLKNKKKESVVRLEKNDAILDEFNFSQNKIKEIDQRLIEDQINEDTDLIKEAIIMGSHVILLLIKIRIRMNLKKKKKMNLKAKLEKSQNL